jgi:hypothetical protein
MFFAYKLKIGYSVEREQPFNEVWLPCFGQVVEVC